MRLVKLVLIGMVGTAQFGALPVRAQEDATQQPIALDIAGEDEIGDHHEGYYYPAPQTVEHYSSRVVTLPDSDEIRRQGFVIGMARQLVSGQYAPDYAIFAKGDEAQKLIITGLHDGSLDTIYRARALFASMTLIARSTPFFQQNTQPEEATFFDLLKLLGFTQVTISDGKKFCHQVIID
nr:molybdopterin-guanine dinucleotide biosynthesis protein A [uncultured Dongia sp.]